MFYSPGVLPEILEAQARQDEARRFFVDKPPKECGWCGQRHGGTGGIQSCVTKGVKRIEYHEDGTVKSVEYWKEAND